MTTIQPKTVIWPPAETRIRTTGVAGGTLMIVDVVLHLFVDDRLTPSALAGLPHEVWHLPGIAALPLVLLGLIGTHVDWPRPRGRRHNWGFALLVVGVTVGAIYSTLFHGIFLPAIEQLQPGLFETLVDNTTPAQFYRGFVVQALGLGLGALLLGSAILHSPHHRSLAGWMLIGAALLAAANQATPAAQLLSRVLFGAAFITLGFGPAPARRPHRPMATAAP